MQKARCRRWRTLVLFVLVLILGVGLLIPGVGTLLAWVAPGAQVVGSAHHQQDSSCTFTRREPVSGGSLVVNEREVECGDLTIFGSTLDVKGQVRGNILAFGSNINITGSVDGDVNLYGGTLTMLNGSRMHGDINLFGGNERQESGGQLDGAIHDRSQRISLWLPGVGTEFAFPFWSIVTWAILGLVLISLFPEHMMFVRTTVASKTRRSLFLGLLSLLLAPVVLIILTALIISIPLAILIAIGLIVAWAFGTVAIGWLVGEYIMRAIAPRHNTRLAQVTVGLTALVLVGSLPYIGWIVSVGAGLLGLGAVFLSRFGTRLYSQPRQPLTF
ncbi:MAG TPA: hypothetical protein VFV38_09235 [Ktedonobacteraceae bacterium]|nr:hypothetical protein [Ktedonobacteraceae bacterium]